MLKYQRVPKNQSSMQQHRAMSKTFAPGFAARLM
nr:MAG TPA: hypothetical protein [Caudoviricetes sp.]